MRYNKSVMERLPATKRAAVLSCLMEGASIRSTARITGTAYNTVLGMMHELGEAITAYHDKVMVNLPCRIIQLDEIWSFVGCKEKAKEKAKGERPGDVWTWTSLCAETKLIPCWRVGDRSSRTAIDFCNDLAPRFKGRVQVTSDGHGAYRFAVGLAFKDADFAQLVKIYGNDDQGREICVGARKEAVFGDPDMDLVSTSYVERSNLSIRMTNRRFTRLTNGFSKKLANHCKGLAITFMAYNFCRKHKTLKKTPAMAAGITDHVWTVQEVIDMVDAYGVEKADAEFEAAFEAVKYTAPRKKVRQYQLKPKLTPWYLDPQSGGPNPPLHERKAGIQYEGTGAL